MRHLGRISVDSFTTLDGRLRKHRGAWLKLAHTHIYQWPMQVGWEYERPKRPPSEIRSITIVNLRIHRNQRSRIALDRLAVNVCNSVGPSSYCDTEATVTARVGGSGCGGRSSSNSSSRASVVANYLRPFFTIQLRLSRATLQRH